MTVPIISGFPHLLHGGDYNPDQWLHDPHLFEEDIRLMKLSGCNTFALGIFAWTALEPKEGEYRFDWLDKVMDRFAAEGFNAILATPSGAKPAWMSRRYPEIRQVDRKGLRDTHRGRHNFCWTSPVYREKVRQINTALAQRYGAHPALAMWHLSNEYAGTEGNGECFCDYCLQAWQLWLRQRYGSLETLNQAWWTAFWSHTFTAWEEIHPAEWSIDGLMLDWSRFVNWQIEDFLRWESQPLRALAPAIPITTNFMGVNPFINYASLSQVVDVVADDQYPCYEEDLPDLAGSKAWPISFKHDYYRNFKKEIPFFLMESCPDGTQWRQPQRAKPQALHFLEMIQALGHGAEGTCYFQWRKGRGGSEKFHGAVVDHEGTEQGRIFQTVQALSAHYEKLDVIIGSRPSPAQCAVIFDWEAWRGFEFSSGPQNHHHAYREIAQLHHRALAEPGRSVDVISSEADFQNYRLLIAPQLYMLKPGVADKLRHFVANGGILAATVYTGMVGESNLVITGGWPGHGLQEVFGLWYEENDGLPANLTRPVALAPTWREKLVGDTFGQTVCGLVHLRGAEAVATYQAGFYKGHAALTRHRFGWGAAWFLATHFPLDFLRRFHDTLCREANVGHFLPAPLPHGVMVQQRQTQNQRFLFLENFNDRTESVEVPAGSWTGLLPTQLEDRRLTLPAHGCTVLSGRE